MNKREYTAYVDEFWDFMGREGLANLSTLPTADGDSSEPYFSWRPCECCGRPEGGDRYDCNGYIPVMGEIGGPYSVCTDCVYFAEYGQLDDMTMLEVEKSQD